MRITFEIILLLICCLPACKKSTESNSKLKILIDSDANNVLDDQHALAYAFLNPDVFDVVGVTVNNTRNGGGLQGQFDEAERIIGLFNLEGKVPLLKGADKSYAEIAPTINCHDFDGKPAVDFIIKMAMGVKGEKLILVELGKLTNIALAFLKEPAIVDKVRVIWLGGNYPDKGEYNLENDTSAVNPVIASGVDFEMVTVRYRQPTGTAAVKVTPYEIEANMKGKGPVAEDTIIGRHGGKFVCFGDYSVSLFQNAKMFGDPPSRALFDMVVLAVLKNKNWGEPQEIPAPKLIGNAWRRQYDSSRTIIFWQNFNRNAIVDDLFDLMEKSTPKD